MQYRPINYSSNAGSASQEDIADFYEERDKLDYVAAFPTPQDEIEPENKVLESARAGASDGVQNS